MKAIVTVGERLQLIKDWQCSGLTVSEWCRRNGIHKNTFCNWIHRSRKQGLLETPAVIPQPIDQDPIKQDIVKIEVSPEQPKYSMNFFSDDNTSDNLAERNHLAVMVINMGNIRIKVTNQINPQLLAETIRLLGGNA